MPDVIITPGSGIIDFYPSGKTASVYATGSNLILANPSGNFLFASTTGLSPNALLHAYSSTSGASILNVEGTNGSLFSIVDNLSGTLMAVNNSAGLPVLEVFSDDSVVAGRFNQNDLVVSSGGNIGMGTASPSGKLDVRGNANISGTLLVDARGQTANSYSEGIRISAASDNYSIVTYGADPTVSSGAITNQWWTGKDGRDNGFNIYNFGGGDRFHILTNGNVGVGTIVPSTKCHISGGALTVDPTTNGNYNEGIRVASATNGYSLVAFGVNPNSSSGTQSGQWWIGRDGSTTGLNIDHNGTSYFHIRNNGNVGIGTKNPSGTLHVVGSGFIGNTSGLAPNATLHVYSSVSGNTVFNAEGTNGSLFSVVDNLSGALMSVNTIAGLPAFQVNSDYSISGGRYNQNDFVITSGGNIGMGTSSPSGKLDVRGNAYISGNLGIGIPSPTGQFQVIGTGNIDTLNIRQRVDGTSAFNIYSANNTYQHSLLATSAGYNFKIDSAGSIFLDVASASWSYEFTASDSLMWRLNKDFFAPGNAATGTASIYASVNGYVGFYQVGGTNAHDAFSLHDRISNSGWGVALYYNSGIGITKGLVISNSGNIGIGTTSPTVKLHVLGSGLIASGLAVSGSLTLNGTGVSLSGHTHTSSEISDFNEGVDDRVSSLLVAGSGIGLSYNDSGNSLTITSQVLPTTKQSYNIISSSGTFTVTAGYTAGYLDVYHNGVKLIDGSDYTATNGTTFVLTNPAVSGDVVEALSSRASVALQSLMEQAYINALNAVTNNVGGMLYLWANYR